MIVETLHVSVAIAKRSKMLRRFSSTFRKGKKEDSQIHRYMQGHGDSQMNTVTANFIVSLILIMIQLHCIMSDSVNVLRTMMRVAAEVLEIKRRSETSKQDRMIDNIAILYTDIWETVPQL